jgi:hypothetical protein
MSVIKLWVFDDVSTSMGGGASARQPANSDTSPINASVKRPNCHLLFEARDSRADSRRSSRPGSMRDPGDINASPWIAFTFMFLEVSVWCSSRTPN